MFRRPIVGLICVTLLATALSGGCDSSPATTTAPEGHTGKNAAGGGHSGTSPAAGPNSPDAKKTPPKS